MEGISNAEAAEHKIGGPKHIDTIRQKQSSENTVNVQGTVADKAVTHEGHIATAGDDDDDDDDDDECDSPCQEGDDNAVIAATLCGSDIEMVGRNDDDTERGVPQDLVRGHGRLSGDNDSVIPTTAMPFTLQTQITEIPTDSDDDADAKVMTTHVILRDEENGEREKSKWESHAHDAETILIDHIHQCR